MGEPIFLKQGFTTRRGVRACGNRFRVVSRIPHSSPLPLYSCLMVPSDFPTTLKATCTFCQDWMTDCPPENVKCIVSRNSKPSEIQLIRTSNNYTHESIFSMLAAGSRRESAEDCVLMAIQEQTRIHACDYHTQLLGLSSPHTILAEFITYNHWAVW